MPTTDVRGPRLVGLDRLRGAALLLMLVHHLTGWFGRDGRAVMPGWDGFAVTDVAAVAFTVALGASVPMLLASRTRRGQRSWRLAGTVVRRYGLLIPIGVALRAARMPDLPWSPRTGWARPRTAPPAVDGQPAPAQPLASVR